MFTFSKSPTDDASRPAIRNARAVRLLICLLVGLPVISSARTLEWAGYTWTVKEGVGLAPGPNTWSDSTQSVWVDGMNRLHLKVTESNGVWSSAEVINHSSLGYGDYHFQLDSRVDQYDPTIVAGLFTFLNDTNEIDIEFTQAFSFLGTNNATFVTQPSVPANRSPFFLDQSSITQTTHRFSWQSTQIVYQSYFTHADAPPSNSVIISSFTYTSNNIPLPDQEKTHINIWQFNNQPPIATQNLELIVRDFQFTPLTPPPSLSAIVNVSAVVGPGLGSFLNIDASTLDFGTVNPSPTDHRFRSNILTCEFFAASGPWSIEVTSDNPADAAGLAPVGGGIPVQLKFNQPNYGNGDPEDDVNWTGLTAVWRPVIDNDAASPLVLGSSAEGDTPDIPFSFAIDVDGLAKTNYSGLILFDLVIE